MFPDISDVLPMASLGRLRLASCSRTLKLAELLLCTIEKWIRPAVELEPAVAGLVGAVLELVVGAEDTIGAVVGAGAFVLVGCTA